MKKIIGFIVCTLLITATGLSVAGINENRDELITNYTTSNIEYSPPSTGLFEWPMFRYELNNTGYSPSLAPDDDTVLWSKYIGDWIYSNPTIKDERVYIVGCNTDHADLWCLNAFTGDEVWVKNLGSESVWGSPTVANNRVYILGVGTFNLYCIDADTGDILWTYPEHGHCSPMVVDDKVYFGSYGGPSHEGGFYCLNATTGDLIWSFDTTVNYEACTPAIVNGKVYVGSNPGSFYCLDADTGDVIWVAPDGGGWSSPSVFNNKVYIATDHLYCLNAETGNEIWSVSGIATASSPAVAYGNVYIGSGGGASVGQVFCFDLDTGDLIWSSPQLDENIWNGLAVADDKLYTASNDVLPNPGHFNCLDAFTGEILWQYTFIATHIYSSPAVAYGNVYVGSGEDGYIYAFGMPNEPPEIPSKPEGPTSGVIDIEYEFSTSTEDPEGDGVYYLFDWGDGTNSGWIGPYASGATVNASHIWTVAGDYEIRVKAHDGKRESNWSDSHMIEIVDELKPILDIGAITGGLFKVRATIKNIGDVDATNVNWSIKLDGGAFIGKETTGADDIPAGGEITATSKLILGLGSTTVTVTAESAEGVSDTREQSGFVFLFFIKVNPGG